MENKNDKIKVYIAAGWFDEFQEKALEYIENLLFNNDKFEVYSPRKEDLLESGSIHEKEVRQRVFQANVKNIKDADLLITSTVGKDMGTIFESGYANAAKIPIIYTLFDERLGENVVFNLMLSESGIACFTNKQEFENFIDKITKENVSTIKQDYEGAIE